MRKLIKKVLHPKLLLVVALVCTIIATFAFLAPSSTIPKVRIEMPIAIDKIVHFTTHLVLVLCWLLFYKAKAIKVKVSRVVLIVAFCVLYGIIIELLQGVSTTRSSELADVYANILGTALGTLVFLLVKREKEIKV